MADGNVTSQIAPQSFKARWSGPRPQLGMFARLTAAGAYETYALTSLDVVVVDLEHGSFDRQALHLCVSLVQAGNLTVLVRVPEGDVAAIQYAVNVGADGIIVPHVSSAEALESTARFVRTTAIERAYAGGGRASRQRLTSWTEFRQSRSDNLLLIAQIDEPPGVAAASTIVQVKGIDGVFLGGIGLALAMNASAQATDAALAEVCGLCRDRGLPVGLSLPDTRAISYWRAQGVNLFVVDSDQSILRRAIETRLSECRALLSDTSDQPPKHLPPRTT
jgi:staphyloferrin B biosynthesis citrate synthase